MAQMNNKREKIVNTTLNIIHKKGINKLTTKSIAKEMKISEGTIYHYFKSKSDIILYIANMVKDGIESHIYTFESPYLNSIEKIKKIFFYSSDDYIRNKTLIPIIYSKEILRDEKDAYNLIQSSLARFSELFLLTIIKGQQNEEIKRELDPSHITYIISGSLSILVDLWYNGKVKNLEAESHRLWETIQELIAL